MQYRTGLVLGRFQPIHRGHIYLMQKALEQCEAIVIVVGSTNVTDEKNPFGYDRRRKMILGALAKFKLSERVKDIVAIPDNPSDDAWVSAIRESVGQFDVVFGNNEWPNKIFEDAGYTVIRVPYHNRAKYEGSAIRRSLNAHEDLDVQLQRYLD